ncbi:sodium-dependent nutrient amino acid transporter 1-like [Oppia nitens]|uniref:sodium-dependent nutrient amino acid transporter 1-like n=1 Tax=Oppia nitens TaxID=1686743 RepID=UPI0023DAF7E5|nr:sodium-dependent nutrient amino acid transporter 1-like [Oppia nitens]
MSFKQNEPQQQQQQQQQLTNTITGNTNETQETDHEIKGRGKWAKGLEFLLSCISLSVGLGNVWRFPHAAYTNGGGAFLIPYLIILFIIGRPLYYMELVLGQFSGRGPIRVWKCVPAFKGIGVAQIVTTIYITIFYNYLMAITLYYLFSSFQNPLPWSVCDEQWIPGGHCPKDNQTNPFNRTWADLYYEHNVLHKSSGLDDINWISWRIVLCLMGSWILVWLSIVKGVSSLGKVSYFTAIFPYTVLIALLGVALSMDGAWDGIKWFFTPEWSKLLEPIVWYRAVEQSFFSLAVCFGSLIMYSSYNEFNNNVYRDAIIIAVLDTCTSLLAGCVIFSNLGHLAKVMDKDIKDVVEGGPGLTFVVYPHALSTIKWVPQLWSVLFFLMFFTLGIGSSVAQVETILTAIKDEFTSLHQKKGLLAAIACSLFFLCGLPLATDAGTYVMQLLDNYGVGTAVFFYGICQSVGIFWIYGLRRFCSDIKFMLSQRVSMFWKVTWGFATPVALIVIFIYGNVEIANSSQNTVGMPAWGTGIGWALAMVAMIQVPLWIIVTIIMQKGDIVQKIIGAFKASPDWGPISPKIFQKWVEYNNEKKRHSMGYINSAFTSDNVINSKSSSVQIIKVVRNTNNSV